MADLDVDKEAVEFLRDWGFKNPGGARSVWEMHMDASAELKRHSFLVSYCSPMEHNTHIRLSIKDEVVIPRMLVQPGYFCLVRKDHQRGHETEVDLGYASGLSYDSVAGMRVFTGYGVKMAKWTFYCGPQPREIQG